MNNPLISIGFVNCSRLFYLKSCVESFLECTQDYEEKELIIVDNASVESGTEEYLKEKEAQGFKVFRQTERDPNNEFAKALNIICEESNGEFIIPLQSDSQFIIRGGWIKKYVELYSKNTTNIGCITLDAQRKITIKNNKYVQYVGDEYKFFPCLNKPPIMGACDVMYSKEIIEMIYPWGVNNLSHEGGSDSETSMLLKVQKMIEERNLKIVCVDPAVPPAIAIYTDPRGTMARVRGNKRYGSYWEAKRNNQYYEYINFEEALELNQEIRSEPIGIEFMAEPIGFEKMLDDEGNWKKNPIRIDQAKPEDWVEL